MSVVDGGRVAARGFQYQYLRTLEALLDAVADSTVTAVRVEGPPAGADGADAVDFDVVGADGLVATAAQVKSRVPGAVMSSAEVFGLLVNMITDERRHGYNAGEYVLLTNATAGANVVDLMQALADVEATEPVLRDRLTALLRGAPARLEQLARLTSAEFGRLRCTTARFDSRDSYQLREELRERMRSYRQEVQPGLGMKSAGLLTGYLMSEILDRASRPDGAFTIEQFREHLLSNDTVLSFLVGYRDWGAVIGPMAPPADIARPDLLALVTKALGFERGRRVVSRTVLVGPSGIGKSSLAAAAVADLADNYDMIFWLDSESDESLTLGLRHAVATLGNVALSQPAGLSRVELINEVHARLSRFPGRWLIVFDDVRSARRIEPWLPMAGDGRVLITSLDASANWGPAAVVEVGPMTTDEAVKLLTARLGADLLQREDDDRMRLLAQRMECWPLALELAAGYMSTCGLPLSAVDRYLDQVARQAMDDEDALPPSYPRTLAAAIHLCLSAVADRSMKSITDNLAMGMIAYSGYLGSRQIPIHLVSVASACQIPDDQDTSDGPLVLDPQIARPLEAVRQLRHFSLMARDTPLQTTGEKLVPDGDETITVNAIVQEVVRSYTERHVDVPGLLRIIAHHTARWLLGSAGQGAIDRTATIAAHADVLVGHLTDRDVRHPDIAILLGNLAGAYLQQGDAHQAVTLLRRELDVLSSGPVEIKGVQARLMLATTFLRGQIGHVVSEREVLGWLGEVLFYARDVMDDYPNATSKLCCDAIRELNGRAQPVADEQGFARILAAFGDLEQRVPAGPFTQAIRLVTEASVMLSNGQPGCAEAALRRALILGSLRENVVLAERLLLEALVNQHRFTEAQGLFTHITGRYGTSGMFHESAADLIHNVGLACAVKSLAGVAPARGLLSQILAWPLRTVIAPWQDVTWRSRVELLWAIDQCFSGDRQIAHTWLADARNGTFGRDATADGWLQLKIYALTAARAER